VLASLFLHAVKEAGFASMACNDKYFAPPVRDQTFLRARGFDAEGFRSGGIISPRLVELPIGTVLFRLYHDPKKRFGEWWSTPHELSTISDYFARSGPAFATGRAEGKGILHATLAVRHDWSGNSPQHLGRFLAVRLAESLKAYHGEGDHAPMAHRGRCRRASGSPTRATATATRGRSFCLGPGSTNRRSFRCRTVLPTSAC
jgi:hypothetical protein